jgi:hypothetical protein
MIYGDSGAAQTVDEWNATHPDDQRNPDGSQVAPPEPEPEPEVPVTAGDLATQYSSGEQSGFYSPTSYQAMQDAYAAGDFNTTITTVQNDPNWVGNHQEGLNVQAIIDQGIAELGEERVASSLRFGIGGILGLATELTGSQTGFSTNYLVSNYMNPETGEFNFTGIDSGATGTTERAILRAMSVQ